MQDFLYLYTTERNLYLCTHGEDTIGTSVDDDDINILHRLGKIRRYKHKNRTNNVGILKITAQHRYLNCYSLNVVGIK